MPSLFLAHAIVPAFCEEAIRSSYLYYLGDRGSRRGVVLSIGAVFVVGEVLYDATVYPLAKEAFGVAIALPMFVIAILSGALLHIALTLWTARRLNVGQKAWIVFALALLAHLSFNLVALSVMEALI